jgi:long-subunit acyl-CoA synthetase (AMP-forming)
VKRVYLTNEAFSVENLRLTPTLKVRRKEVQKGYKVELDALYALGEPTWSVASKL